MLRRLAAASTGACAAALRELNQLVTQPTHQGHPAAPRARPSTPREPLAEYVVPAQTVCNYWNYWFTFLPDALSEPRPGRLLAAARRSPRFPGGARRSRSPRRRLLRHPGQRQAARRPAGGEFKPVRAPDHSTRIPTARPASTNADCQPGQIGYPLGQLPGPRPAASPTRPTRVSDLPGSPRPDDRVLQRRRRARAASTRRVDSRQPETWEGARSEGQATRAAAAELGDRPGAASIVLAIGSLLAFTKELPWSDALRGPRRLLLGAERAHRARRCGSPASTSAR